AAPPAVLALPRPAHVKGFYINTRTGGTRVDQVCQWPTLSRGRIEMATMNVSLSEEFVDFVNREVASGEYGSASEVVRDALRRLRREKAAEEEKLAILRREIAIGLEDARAG